MRTAFIFLCALSPLLLVGGIVWNTHRKLANQIRRNRERLKAFDALGKQAVEEYRREQIRQRIHQQWEQEHAE